MNNPSAAAPRPTWRDYLELVKFSHTIFALPFALSSMLIAARGLPSLRIVGWILVAMVTARTAAMGFNRIVDRKIDAANPRTAGREIPAGKISVGQASTLVAVSASLFVVAAYQLNMLAFALALPALAILFFYSFCKRFTSWSHMVLGLCLGIAPIGAWIAVRARWEWEPLVLGAAVLFWVAGFDIIYATLDEEFDRKAGLRSMVQNLGIPGALLLARVLHLIFIALLFWFGRLVGLGVLYAAAIALIGLFLVYEHALVKPADLRRVNAAFFTVNGVISVFFLVAVAVEVFF
ncbi:MAG TPA: UbiA-like polyprenyltransferase [Abditibacteriaceae bacterium]|nr:UbiA-like polyprenyltransferase [Abditibacteriaceae bacterium]